MSNKLFDPKFVYPIDDVGPHIELKGEVIGVKQQDHHDASVRVDVRTPEGDFHGYTARPPKIGYYARIRIYEAGGGWYPDNQITGWSEQDVAYL